MLAVDLLDDGGTDTLGKVAKGFEGGRGVLITHKLEDAVEVDSVWDHGDIKVIGVPVTKEGDGWGGVR